MKNMSFSLTTDQVIARTKDVTRRIGWDCLKAGDQLCAIRKGQGLRKGEKVERLGIIRITRVNLEPLAMIEKYYDQEECRREGFPYLSPVQFVEMFCRANNCDPSQLVNRIVFKYL